MKEGDYLTKEERVHIVEILKRTRKALADGDSTALRELSNQTIHSASVFQDAGSITFAVIIYALSKLLERKETLEIKNWESFSKKVSINLERAIESIENQRYGDYIDDLHKTRKIVSSISENLSSYVQEVLRKASINKASKIYEHGLSMERTSRLLGITQWELSEYIGQGRNIDIKQNQTIDIKKRIKGAMEFFS